MQEANIHEQIAESLLKIDQSDFTPGQDLLDEGKWITYDDPMYPGYIVKEYPDGTKELLDEFDGVTVKILIKP